MRRHCRLPSDERKHLEMKCLHILALRLDTESDAASADPPPCESCVGPEAAAMARISHCHREKVEHIPPSGDSLTVRRRLVGELVAIRPPLPSPPPQSDRLPQFLPRRHLKIRNYFT